jgi:hypothetical protein
MHFSPALPGDPIAASGMALRALTAEDARALGRYTRLLAAQQNSPEIVRAAETLLPSAPQATQRMLRLAVRLLPDDHALGLAYCRIAEGHAPARLALGCWRMLCNRQPDNLDAHRGYIESLIRLRPAGAARQAAQAAAVVHPGCLWLHETSARLAERMHDWQAALAHWRTVLDLDPAHAEAAAGHRLAAQLFRPAESLALPVQPSVPAPAAIPPVSAPDHAQVRARLLGFEGLGSDCEFGLLQRKFGAEPLGLLRFAATFPRAALMLLRSRFEGIGDPEHTTLAVRGRAFTVHHRRSGWRMHTKLEAAADADAAQVHKQQCRHSAFLRKKLVSDLERGRKIFVYQRHDLSDAQIDALYHAVQEYGPNTLLCVRLADAAHPPGSVEWRTERLMIGAIDRTGRRARWDISVDQWVRFCRIAQEKAAPEPLGPVSQAPASGASA